MTFNAALDSITNAITHLQQQLPVSASFIALLFCIQIINACLRYRLNILGIWPRKKFGWIGIPFMPFLHGNFAHLIFNAFPLFIFSNFILLQGTAIFIHASIVIIILSGILIWLFGRAGIHVGASALIMGYLGFIVIGIYHQPNALSIVIGIVCLIYFGSLFTNLFPSTDRHVSWEGHVFGFIAGIAAAYLLPLTLCC